MADMKKAFREAALLRNRLEGCLKASANRMALRELVDWPSVAEVAGTGPKASSRVGYLIANMVKEGKVDRVGRSHATTYSWIGGNGQQQQAGTTTMSLPATSPPELTSLHVQVNRAANKISFTLANMRITLEIIE